MISYVHNIFEILSFLVAVFYYRYLRTSFMKWFLPFLAAISLGELLSHNNSVAFFATYLLSILVVVFYGYIFHCLIRTRLVKFLIIVLTIGFSASYMISFLFLDTGRDFMFYFMINFLCFGVFITAISLSYLYGLVVSEEGIFPLRMPGFWIAFGVTIFYSCTSVIFALYPIIVAEHLLLFGIPLHRVVPRLLCILLYSSLSVAIILCKKYPIESPL